MTDTTIFEPVGRCIYCGATDDLSDEHIVPLGLGGTHLLPRASCRKCAAITSTFEGVVLRTIYGDFRIRKGMPTRHKKQRPPTRLINTVTPDGRRATKAVPSAEFPAPMWVYTFGRCGLLLNAPDHLDVSNGNMMTVHEHEALEEFAKTHGWDRTTVVKYRPDEFRRMLLKIGYGMAVAIFGLDSFAPVSLPYFMTPGGKNLSYMVGQNSKLDPTAPDAGHLIHLRLVRTDRAYVISEIKLFANFGTPTYHVIVGRFESDDQLRTAVEKFGDARRKYASLDVSEFTSHDPSAAVQRPHES